ncbi:MAG: hypothetical protein E7464_02050 [Ruminococcaceae bacterium]|nr:hypothetical protein [Oscillospiraceae bacterium]
MKFVFDINPAAATSSTILAIIIAIIMFIVVPVVLAVTEYRLTKKNKNFGLYLLAGIFAGAVLFGLYALFLGLVLLIVYFSALRHGQIKDKPM